ncbi:unnamed protein product, partial [Heterotrigona itama]
AGSQRDAIWVPSCGSMDLLFQPFFGLPADWLGRNDDASLIETPSWWYH